VAKYDRWLTEDGLLLLGAWARDGLTDEKIAENMGISRSTLNDWKKKFPDISDTLKKNKEIADVKVENSLYQKAIGIKEVVKKPIKVKEVKYRDGKRVSEKEHIEYAEEEVYIPPDTGAQVFWLKNRRPDKWKDKPIDTGDAGSLEAQNELIKAIKEAVKDED